MSKNITDNKESLNESIDVTKKIEDEVYEGPGLDKQAALYMARQVNEDASPCGYCNRGDCMECSFAYK